MSLLTLEAKLERTDKSTPWGFRMQGGKDYSTALTIQRVTPGSLAAKCGLQAGDIILKIGNAGAEHLRHKEAQDIIVSCPNRLDLLLQRLKEKKIPEVKGGSGQQPAYDKFPVSPIGGTSAPAPGGFQTSVNFNAAPKPFGAPAAPSYSAPSPSGPGYGGAPPPPPMGSGYGGSNIGSLSQQTQNMSLSGDAPDYMQSAKKYSERETAPDPTQNQSRSFKFLQGLMDSGQEPPSSAMASGGPSQLGGAPSQPGKVKAIMAQRYNNPIGLYSDNNVERELEGQSKFLIKDDMGVVDQTPTSSVIGNNSTSNQNNSQPGPRPYYPSETFKLVQEQENQVEKEDERYEPAQSRSLKILQEQLQSGGGITPGQAAGGAKPASWTPKPAPVPAPIVSAPASKPWAPSSAPPPPPMGGQRPGGQGLKGPPQRGKKGDAVIRQQGATGVDIPRVATCAQCGNTIRGPFVVALSKTWCPDHFTCANPRCGVKLIDIGFVEEGGYLYCERDYEQHFAPRCEKCKAAIVGECVNALQKSYHPQCFLCFHCKQPIGGNQFHIEDGNSYCEKDWNAMFQTMCAGCNFPIEPGDKWVEAMNKNFHSECFNCATCQVSLEGAPFYVKAGKPFCKKHVR